METLFSAVWRTIPSSSKHFNLFGIDTTPCPRPFAETLADKTFIHYPNPIKGNKPINIGHCYSVVCALPDPIVTDNVPWAARKLAAVLPRDWEQYLKTDKSIKLTPSLVQRDFSRIISTLGTSAKFPQRRGYSPGRIKGYKKAPRTRHQVIRKGQKKSDEKLKAF